MIRLETKHLFSEGVSPNIKKLIMKRRSGISLTERELDRLKRFNESVSITKPTPLHNRIVKLPKPIQEPNSFDDLDDDDELNLQEIVDELEWETEMDEILKEMGYGGDD